MHSIVYGEQKQAFEYGTVFFQKRISLEGKAQSSPWDL